MLVEHGPELEADFQQFYGLDLPGLIDSGEWRRAGALASQLPRESRTVRSMDPRLRWGDAEYLLALIADNIAFARYEQGGGRGRKPRAVKRPVKDGASKRKQDRTVHGLSKGRVGEILARPRT